MPARTISKLAQEAGVHVETVRYYERIGLLEQPERPDEGWRVYSDEAVKRIRFIKRAQELSLTLDEIHQLIKIGFDLNEAGCAEVRELTDSKRREVSDKIRSLQAVHSRLKELVERCDSSESEEGCPIINALENPEA
ncbi:MAG: MerR family transcriptional regulator [Bradymonadaceae bacterium]|nr:MerR family transcriptional regulator [Lujinxingiaceae bacterium]